MTRLALEQAPAASLPRRFLLSAPLWGMLAGVLLIVDGDALLRTRWDPATLALVHALTLGVLGNAMFGSVLQFLPAAVGVRLRGAARCGSLLHGLLNLGVAVLVVGLRWSSRGLLLPAAALLLAAFALLAAMTLPGLLIAQGQRLLRAGLDAALVTALCTATLGALLALGLAARLALPLSLLTDVHAAWGLLGWIVLLIASVARVVMPMFQGTATVAAPAQATWLLAALLALLAGSMLWLGAGDGRLLRAAVGIGTLAFAAAALWLQWRTPRPRNDALRGFWRAGLLALVAVALALLHGSHDGLLAGVLGIGVGLPLLTVGMQLQIVGFLGWIPLHRRCGRGVHLPGVQRLLPEANQLHVLRVFLVSALLLPAAVLWPRAWLVRGAGLAVLLAYGVLWWALLGVRRRADRFVMTTEGRA